MSDTLTATFQCEPGRATPERALECQRLVLDLLTTIADDVAPGVVMFIPQYMCWVDDGKDEIVVRVTLGPAEGEGDD